MLHTHLMVADGWLVAQSGWPISVLARRAGPIDTRGRRPAARRLEVGADVVAAICSAMAAISLPGRCFRRAAAGFLRPNGASGSTGI